MIVRQVEPEFKLAEARHIVRDLFEHNATTYWVDFLATIFTGYACLLLYFSVWRWSGIDQVSDWRLWAIRAVFFVPVCILFYRAANFIHELSHMKDGEFAAFRWVWNLLCGVPFLMPAFLYRTHLDHHRRKHYGTEHDGEYLPFGTTPPWNIIAFMAAPFVVPALTVFRFLVLSPLSWMIPPLREWVLARASSMVIDPFYVREVESSEERWMIFWQEFLCFLFAGGTFIAFCFNPEFVGFRLITAYAIAVVIVTVNNLRTLGAHAWMNEGEEMSFTEQLLDSYNYPNGWTAELWGPVGLRYHALHHLFPSMPYHNMAEAHRRLMRELPEDSPYRDTVRESLLAVLLDLWQQSVSSSSKTAPVAPA